MVRHHNLLFYHGHRYRHLHWREILKWWKLLRNSSSWSIWIATISSILQMQIVTGNGYIGMKNGKNGERMNHYHCIVKVHGSFSIPYKCRWNIFCMDPLYFTSSHNYISDYLQGYESINPCEDPNKDFFVMKSDDEEQLVGNKLTRRLKSLNRVEGCCQTLELSLQTEKLKTIMNLVKFSIGSTIPRSPEYNNINFTQTNEDLSILRLQPRLKDLLQKRYLGVFL